MLFFLFLAVDARAGALKPFYQSTTSHDFVDWEYAQKVWFEMRTRDAAMTEYGKYRDVFKPWIAKYYNSGMLGIIRENIEASPEPERQMLRRGYDVQLAYDQWFDEVYQKWFKAYPAQAMAGTARTFDQVLAEFAKRPACVPQQRLDECGPVPDWRDAEDRAKEREMMRKADEAAAEVRRKR